MSKKNAKQAAGPKQEAKSEGEQAATQKKTRGGKVTGVQPAAADHAAEATVELIIDQTGIHSLTAGARPAKKATKGAAVTPKPAEAVPEPVDDAGELVVFAFRLSRAERDLIHAAAGSAKASRFVRTLAVAAARGDGPAVLGILDTIQTKQ